MGALSTIEKGTLYWITGLAGSGKTTIGTQLYYRLREKNETQVVILDGDILKNIVGADTGYTYEDRLSRAKRYSQLCKFLVDQGIDVIICTIAMFDSIRSWNRKYIEKYIEVFLDVPESVLVQRNKKGLYAEQKKNVVGRDVKVELPKNPDIIIKNDGKISVNDCVNQIINYIPSAFDTYNRDREYWNNYYSKDKAKSNPSQFAMFISNYLKPGHMIMDLGCGNGRDSTYFLDKGMYVIGIDASDLAITKLKSDNQGKTCEFICDDFVSSKILFQRQTEHCYSRFTLHAISESQEDILLENVYTALKPNGYFYIEARSVNDDLYGKGEEVAKNTYIFDGHYRRFIEMEVLINKLQECGFEIEFANEGRGFSPLGDNDPVLIRIICRK